MESPRYQDVPRVHTHCLLYGGFMSDSQTPVLPPRPKSGFDPVVLVLSVLIAGLILGALAFVAAGLGRGLIGQTAPQTHKQAGLARTEASAVKFSDDPQTWFNYIKQLIDNKQFSKAQKAIDSASKEFKETDNYDFYIPTAQASLYVFKGDLDTGIKQAIVARDAISQAYEQELKSKKKPNKAEAYGMPENYHLLGLLVAGVYMQEGEYAKAIELLEEYTNAHPTEAGVWIDLGDAYAAAGEKEKAIEAYDETLSFIPDDPEALAGKAKLTGDKK